MGKESEWKSVPIVLIIQAILERGSGDPLIRPWACPRSRSARARQRPSHGGFDRVANARVATSYSEDCIFPVAVNLESVIPLLCDSDVRGSGDATFVDAAAWETLCVRK